ncbi:replication protein [uncultured marine virus]|nr:replication protein [uncultured marine virus]
MARTDKSPETQLDDDLLSLMSDPLDADIDWDIDVSDVGSQASKRPRHNSPRDESSCGDNPASGTDDESARPVRSSKKRSNAYVLVLNNPTERDSVECKEWIIRNCEYGIIGNEVGESGTPHLQVYFRCKNARVFNAIKTVFPGAHIESANSGDLQNQRYCSKEGNFWEHGTISKQVFVCALNSMFCVDCKYTYSLQPLN